MDDVTGMTHRDLLRERNHWLRLLWEPRDPTVAYDLGTLQMKIRARQRLGEIADELGRRGAGGT